MTGSVPGQWWFLPGQLGAAMVIERGAPDKGIGANAAGAVQVSFTPSLKGGLGAFFHAVCDAAAWQANRVL
jgi:hypothetical protein